MLDSELLDERAKNQAMADEIEKQKSQLESAAAQQLASDEIYKVILSEMEAKVMGGGAELLAVPSN